MWIGVGLLFVLFFYHYWKNYNLGYRQGQRTFQLAFDELDKVARRTAFCFMLFILTTYVLLVAATHEMIDCIVKGAIVCGIFLPIINAHYS